MHFKVIPDFIYQKLARLGGRRFVSQQKPCVQIPYGVTVDRRELLFQVNFIVAVVICGDVMFEGYWNSHLLLMLLISLLLVVIAVVFVV